MANLLKFVALEERIVLDAAVAAVVHVIYVDAHAAANGNGSSWAHAYNNVQEALTAAANTPGADQIWIAKGTYTPAQGAASVTSSDTFNLPSNVSLYGGFLAGMTSLSQSNPTLFPTILSGNLGGGVQAWHVVTASGTTNDLIQGVSIVNGDAAGTSTGDNDSGGGILVDTGASVTVSHDLFSNDSAVNQGGAIAVLNGSSLNVSSSSFSSNEAFLNGGAIAAENAASLIVMTSSFTNNQTTATIAAPIGGGAIDDTNTNATLSNDNFIGNQSPLLGGAVLIESLFEVLPGGTAHQYMVNSCLFDNNSGEIGGGGLNATGLLANPSSHLTIESSTFIGNSADSGGGAIIVNLPSTVDNSLFQANTGYVFGGGLCINNLDAFALGIPSIGNLTVTNSSFIDNSVLASQQHLEELSSVILQIFGVQIGGTMGGGGMIVHEDASATISNSLFIDNTTNGDGGGLLNGGATITSTSGVGGEGGVTSISNSTFIGNSSAQGNGGALASVSAVPLASLTGPVDLTVTNSTLLLNSAANNGGALFLDHTLATLNNDLFSLNHAATADEISGADAIINGSPSSSPAALISLLTTNLFIPLDGDDIVLS